jgi:hypothetical protein
LAWPGSTRTVENSPPKPDVIRIRSPPGGGVETAHVKLASASPPPGWLVTCCAISAQTSSRVPGGDVEPGMESTTSTGAPALTDTLRWLCVASIRVVTSPSSPLRSVPSSVPATTARRSTATSCDEPLTTSSTKRASALFIERLLKLSVRASFGLSGEVKINVKLNVFVGAGVSWSTRTSIALPAEPSSSAVTSRTSTFPFSNPTLAVDVSRARRTTQALVPPLAKNWRTA